MRRSALALALILSFAAADWTKSVTIPEKPHSTSSVWLVLSDHAVPSTSNLPESALRSFVATLTAEERASLAQTLAELRARAEAQKNPFLEDFGDTPIEEDALGAFQRYGPPALLMATLVQGSFRTQQHRAFAARACPVGAHCIDIRSSEREQSELHGFRLAGWPLRYAIVVRTLDSAARATFTNAARKAARKAESCIGLVLTLAEDPDPELTMQLREAVGVPLTANAPAFVEHDEVWLFPTRRCFIHGERFATETRGMLPGDARVDWPPL